MPDLRTILCPTDFSDTSRHALEHATAIARWYEARLVGIHVYAPVFAPVPSFAAAGYADPPPSPAGVRDVEQDVFASLEAARAVGLRTAAHVETGSAPAAIVSYARTLPADLIVIGTHGTGGFEHLVLGSVAEKVLRLAACPVMTVPPRARATSRLPYKRLLCPVDFSAPSLAALDFAFSIAQDSDAELTIFHVLEAHGGEPLANRPFSVPEYAIYREQDARVRLARLVPEAVRSWCTPTTRIAHGQPCREILAFAGTQHVDLIVLGVHGRRALDRVLFGSTTSQIVRTAGCPVLTLRS